MAYLCRFGWLLAALVPLSGCRSDILKTGFETDPAADGWRTGVYGGPAEQFRGRWLERLPGGGQHCVAVQTGMWESPALPAVPFAYYRVPFAYRAPEPAYRVVRFFDAGGHEIVADDHNSLDAAADWTSTEFFTQAREGTATVRVGFCAGAGELFIDDVCVTPATPREALAAADRLYATLPPVTCAFEPGRWKELPRTMRLLRERQPLRLLLLGDSIANDIGNSLFHLQIERMYPGARITLLRSIVPGKSCAFFRDHLPEHVVDKAPDLVIVAGISHGNDAAAVRSFAERVRQTMATPVEFLVLTGASIEPGMTQSWKNKGFDSPPADVRLKAVAAEARFYAELVNARAAVPWATLDLRTLWEDYLAHSPHPRSWYQRDFVHANARGKEIMGRMLAQFFAPDER